MNNASASRYLRAVPAMTGTAALAHPRWCRPGQCRVRPGAGGGYVGHHAGDSQLVQSDGYSPTLQITLTQWVEKDFGEHVIDEPMIELFTPPDGSTCPDDAYQYLPLDEASKLAQAILAHVDSAETTGDR
jgi:hypothetical protein